MTSGALGKVVDVTNIVHTGTERNILHEQHELKMFYFYIHWIWAKVAHVEYFILSQYHFTTTRFGAIEMNVWRCHVSALFMQNCALWSYHISIISASTLHKDFKLCAAEGAERVEALYSSAQNVTKRGRNSNSITHQYESLKHHSRVSQAHCAPFLMPTTQNSTHLA